MSRKYLKKKSNHTRYCYSSVNNNNVNYIYSYANPKFSSFNNNTSNYHVCLTPSRESSYSNLQDNSPSLDYVTKLTQNRPKSLSSKYETPKKDNLSDNFDKTDPKFTKYSLEIKKEQVKDLNLSDCHDFHKRRIEYQLSRKCDPIKISKELALLIKKLDRNSDKKVIQKNNIEIEHQLFENDSENGNSMLKRKNRFIKVESEDKKMNVNCFHTYQTRSKSNNENEHKSFKDDNAKIVNLIDKVKNIIDKKEFTLNETEKTIKNEIKKSYSKESFHKSKGKLTKKKSKLRYEVIKNTNESFIKGLNSITDSFPLKLLKKYIYNTCLEEKIIISNALIKESIKMVLKKRFSRYDTLKNLKETLKGKNLVFFKFKSYLHCESIIERGYAIDIKNEIVEIENKFMNFDVYYLVKERKS